MSGPNQLQASNFEPTSILALDPSKLLNPSEIESYDVEVPQKWTNIDYYNEYSKLYLYNFVLTAHANDLYKEEKSLLKKYLALSV